MRSPWRALKEKILRDAVTDPNSWLLKAIQSSGADSHAGARVTPGTAITLAAVYACIKVLSETIASLPLNLYKRVGTNKEPATEHPLYPLFADQPNSYMTSYELRENLVANINYHGNAYQQKVERAGYTRELIPLMSDKMAPGMAGGKKTYTYTTNGEPKIFRASKIWHTMNASASTTLSGDAPEGVVGVSPIVAAREAIGSALAADEYAARYFANNATTGLHAKHPGRLTEDAKEYLKQSLAEYAKLENKFKSIVTEEGLEIDTLGKTNEESQFLETRNFSVEEVARIYRVPAVLIGHPDKTMTYASAEQMFLSFVQHTIRPWCVRLEQSMDRYLIPEDDRPEYFYEHNLNALLRGDTKARFEAYSKARQWGWLSVNEIRAMENLNAIEDGDVYLEPQNMQEPGTSTGEGGNDD